MYKRLKARLNNIFFNYFPQTSLYIFMKSQFRRTSKEEGQAVRFKPFYRCAGQFCLICQQIGNGRAYNPQSETI